MPITKLDKKKLNNLYNSLSFKYGSKKGVRDKNGNEIMSEYLIGSEYNKFN